MTDVDPVPEAAVGRAVKIGHDRAGTAFTAGRVPGVRQAPAVGA